MLSYGMRKIVGTLICLLCAGALSLRGAEGNSSDVAFTSSHDQSTQHYLLKLPEGGAPKLAVLLIALHGHGSDRHQFMNPSIDEARAALDVARSNRCIYVTPDYRAKTSWMGPAAEADLVQIISDLKQQYQVSKTVLCGGSMGGTGALTFAALHPELIDGVVAMNGTANLVEYGQFQDAIQASYGGTKLQVFQEYKKRSAEYWPERLTMPVAITLGAKDTLVPPDSALRLSKVLQTLERPVKVIYREDGGHSTNYKDAIEAFVFVFAALGR
jgi:pimeloyl-ACP methyl ester carboxylesterase